MKTAYLILAHQQPGQVARLIQSLSSEWSYFFVHVDRKADLSAFKAAIPPSRRVCYLPDAERVKVHWGGFSPVQATLRLLDCAYRSAVRFGRYCLLSGADFPIRDNNQIREAFDSDQEFISIGQALCTPGASDKAHNVGQYHYYDHEWLNPRTSPFPALPRLAAQLSSRVPRSSYHRIPLFQGSQWWALTDQMVGYLFNFIRKHPDYLTFQRFTLVPDEVFFHSIVKSSPWAGRINHDFEQGTLPGGTSPERGCHYVDWHSGDTVPKVLDLSDLEKLLASKALFARKFEHPRSAELLDRLESLRGEAGAPAGRRVFMPGLNDRLGLLAG
jgi:hypothetical protein